MSKVRLPDQVNHYLQFCDYRREASGSKQVDLSTCDFIYPTTLLPLSAFASKNQWNLLVDPKTKSGGYLMYVLKQRSAGARGASYVAPITLPKAQDACKPMIDGLNSLRSKSLLYGRNENMYAYVIGELIDNIYQHSGFDYASVMAQNFGCPYCRSTKFTVKDIGPTKVEVKCSDCKRGRVVDMGEMEKAGLE